MKKLIAAILFFASSPVNAHHKVSDYNNHETYNSNQGYAYEEKCFRYEYREDYIPGNSTSPGYVKSYQEKVSIACKNQNNALNHSEDNNSHKIEYVNYVSQKNCNGSTTLGGLIGGGIAASLSHEDAYSWSIPLGAVLGAGIGNASCSN
jgi:hypothetical protein